MIVLKVRIYNLLLAAFLWGGVSSFGQASTGGFSVAITNREAVRTFYNAVYGHRANVPAEWNGSVSNCVEGSTSQAYQEAVLTRLNFYRALAGVPANVSFNPEYSLRAQAAALIMSANDEISHFPVEGWLCFTPLGEEGAANSNLALGSSGVDAIESYIIDSGPNYRVGHRRWVIYPKTQVMGIGDIAPPDGSEEQRANSLWVFDDHFTDPRPPTRESFVAWPPPGYVPNRLVFPRWSFQISLADFSQAVVTVTSNGTPVAVHQEKVEIGYGENGVVFVPHGITPGARLHWEKPEQDIIYNVSIANVVRGVDITNYSYSVIVFDPEVPDGDWANVQLEGSATPPAQRLSAYRFREYTNATAYDFRVTRLSDLPLVEGAEEAVPAVTSFTSGLYPVVQTEVAASGAAAFRLAHSKPPRPQWLMLNDTFVPSAESEVRFKSRLGGASADELAQVEISLDEGSSWREVYVQAGDGTAGELEFVDRSISLAAFAGRAVSIRFNFGLIFGPASIVRGFAAGIGWYIDDIEVTAARRLSAPEVTQQSGIDFEFIPPQPGEYFLDARPRFYTEYRGEWSAGRVVEAVEPEPTRITTQQLRPQGEEVELEFEVSSLAPDAQLKVEQALSLDGPWVEQSGVEISELPETGRYKGKLKKGTGAAAFYRIVAE